MQPKLKPKIRNITVSGLDPSPLGNQIKSKKISAIGKLINCFPETIDFGKIVLDSDQTYL